MQLICAFTFTYAKSRSSHDAAHILVVNNNGADQSVG